MRNTGYLCYKLLLGLICVASSNDSNYTSGISARVRLNDGHMIPVVGLGVALTEDATFDAVKWAISAGYRLIDTAAEESYGNEDSVGEAITEDVFVTTKLWDSDHGFYATIEAFEESYETIGKVDLYLIHSPFGGRLIETWDAMLLLQSKGYVKSIGVSNFGVEHLQALVDHNRPLPAVNQIEMHPLVYHQRASLIQWCRDHDVKIQAYGSLMHGYPHLHESFTHLANRYQKTTAQILLRWALQHEFLIIPKSARRQRILENSLLYDFTLSKADMMVLDQWGDHVTPSDRNIYKEDWNWNPIDEAPVHYGRTHYWPNYQGIHYPHANSYHTDL